MTAAPEWEVLKPLAATPVSRTWRVAVGDPLDVPLAGQLAVLRQDEPGAARLGLNRAAEPDVLTAAAAAGLGPACLRADPAQGLLLTEWLPGQAWTAADLQNPANLRRAAGLLRRLHATPLAGPVVDLAAAIDRYAAAAGRSGAPLADQARADLAQALAAPVAPVAPEGAPTLCFCHNDATPGNFIVSAAGAVRLIDWEYAGLCHPGFDLAGLAVGAGLNRGQVRQLLAAYQGRAPTPAETARHRDWEAFCGSLGILWAAAIGTVPAP